MRKKLTRFAYVAAIVFFSNFSKAQSDNPCGATNLAVNTSCTYQIGTLSAAMTNTTGVPAPGCASYSGPDVWYSMTVPASGSVTVTMDVSGAGPTDMGMALYTGACGSLALNSCDDDNGPGLMPMLTASGLSPGSTVYIRIWEFGGGSFGNFSICAQSAASSGCSGGTSNSSCALADPFCTSITYNLCNTTGVASLGGGGIYGCLGSTPNPAFFYLNISTSGDIDIFLNQTSTAGAPIDVDFCCWGPFPDQASMCPGLSATNIEDCSFSAAATETVDITGAVAGEWYMLLVTNYSGVAGSIDVSQVGGTGATNCSIVAPCSVTATSTPVSCFGGSNGTITATCTGTPAYTVSVVNSGGTTVATSSGAGPTFSFTGLPAGTYTINLSAIGPCTNTTTVTIGGPASALSATSSHTNLTCATPCNGTLTATGAGGTPGYTYSWSGGLGAGANKTGVCAGTYTCTVTDANGCTTTTTQTITAPPALTVSVTPVATTCFGTCNGSITATAAGGTPAYTSYTWSGGIGTGAVQTGECAGTYTVTVTDANGCTATATGTIANGPNVVAGFTYTGTACQSSNSFNFTNTSTGATTYSWNFGAGATPATSTATNPTGVTYSTVGAHTVTLTATNGGCSQTVTQTITTFANPTVTASNTPPPCNVTTGTVSAAGAGGLPSYTYSWSGGLGTGASVSGVAPGTYTVTVTDANGCTGTASTTVVAGPVLTLSTSSTPSTCGSSNGTVTASGVGGGTITYTWYADAAHTIVLGTGATLGSLAAGTYYVVASSSTGCTVSGSAAISTASGPTITAVTNSNVTCFGLCNGSGTATVSGVAPLSILWSNGATTATTNTLCAGSPCVTVTDGNGCTASTCITITQPAALTTALTGTNPLCNTSCNGSVSSLTTGGPGAYTYSWSNGATTANISSVCAGTYTLTVTSGTCTTSATTTLTAPPAITINPAAITTPSCNGLCNGIIVGSATGGTGSLTYAITGLTGGPTFNSVCAGTYTLNVTDANGCTSTQTIVVTQPAPIVITTSSTAASCTAATGTATANVTGGTSPYTYAWSSGGTTASVSGLVAGTYTVTVTDSKGCTQTASVTVGTLAGGTATASTVSNVSCNGGSNGSATVTMAGGAAPFTYAWSSGATTATAAGLPAGTYSVTVTDVNGCTSTSSTTITQPTALTLSAAHTNVSCNGGNNGTATATAGGGTGAITYAWSPSGGTAATATGLAAGTYTVTITDANGCTANTTQTITQPIALTISASMNPTKCAGSCDGQAMSAASGGTGAYTYQWSDPLSQTTANAFLLCAGAYTVTVTDANGCTATATTTVTEPAPLASTVTITNAHCGNADGSACVTITGGTPAYTYSWSNGSTTNCISSVVAGAYVLTVTDANLCTLAVPATITDLGAPTISILSSTNVSCFGDNDGSATVNPSGGTVPYTIQWDAAAASQTTPTASNLTAGTYGVTLTDAAGCITSTSVTITEPALLVHNVNTYDPTCFGFCDGSLAAFSAGGTAPYAYQWVNSGGATIGTLDSIPGLCDGTYTVNITDANGCALSANYILTQPVPVSATLSSTNVTCFGACNGTATATPIAGVAPFSYTWTTGQTTQTATGLCAGATSVTVTDADGCTASYAATITEPTVLDVVISASQMVSCAGLCDGFADINITGGTAPYSVLWSNGTTSNLNNSLCTGTYTVTVTDANGCQDTTSIVIAQPGGLVVTVSGVDLVCNNQCNGSATASITGGTTPYTMLWDDPTLSNTPNITNVCAGFYTIVVTDANGCFVSQSINISQPPAINMSLAATDANCGQNNGQICATAFGGVLPLSYAWSDPAAQTTPCAQNILAGCYTVTVTDANGCFIDSLICINDIAGPTLTLNSSSDVTCFGYNDGSISVTGMGGVGILTYTWVDATAAVISSLTDQTSSSTLGGDTYGITVMDTAGCTASVTQIINEPASFVAAISAQTNVSCFGVCDGTATVVTAGGNGGNTFSWSSGASTTTAANTGICAGTATVTVTDALGCTASATATITQPAALASNVTGFTNVNCFGNCNGTINTATSGGTLPYFYTWTGGVSTTANANSLCSGTYTVTVTDNNGCTATSTQTITEPTALSVIANKVDASCGMCNGLSLANASGGTPGYSYLWPTGVTPTAPNNSGLCVGSHTVTVTDANGCTANATVTIVDQPGPTVGSLTFAQPSCNGFTDGTATVSPAGGTAPVTIAWSDAQTTTTAFGLATGNICVTLTDANGCTATQCVMVTEPNVLTGVADLDQTICFGDSAQVFASGAGGTPAYTITWTTAGMTGAGPIVVSPTTTTTYCMTVTDSKGCISPQDCATITVNPPLSITASVDQSICNGDNTAVNATATGGNGGPYTFTWVDQNNNAVASTTSGSTSNAAVSPTTTTTYFVTVDDGCTNPGASDSVIVTVNALPILFLNAIDQDGCAPFNAQFLLNTDIGTTFYYDFNCDGVVDLTDVVTTASHTYTDPGTYDVCVMTTSAAGCSTSVSQPGLITVYPNPVAEFVFTPLETTIQTPGIDFAQTSTGAISYDWNFGDGFGIDSTNVIIPNGTNGGITTGTYGSPSHVYQDTGSFVITLTVTNEFGCTDDVSHTVHIKPDYAIYVPNSFTPDGDGTNDVFYPMGIGIDVEHFDMYIFTRWGQIIYESHTPNDGWDGTHKGQKSKEDVYVWKVKATDFNGIEHEYIGHVTLLR